jgi:hypothetical protein
MTRLLLLSAALTLAVPVRAMQSAQPPVTRSVPARAIEARIDTHVAQHPKSKVSPANAKSAKAKASSADVVTPVRPIAPRPAMRRQPKPVGAGKKTP